MGASSEQVLHHFAVFDDLERTVAAAREVPWFGVMPICV